MNNQQVTFAALPYVWLIIPVVVMILVLCYRLNKMMRLISLLSGGREGVLLKHFSYARHVIKIISMSVGLIFLYSALLRPQWHQKKQVIAQEGRDLFIALDISRSMLATDGNPNRLASAKQKIVQLIGLLEGARVGLVLFSGTAFVQCPLTNDYAAFNMFLESVDVESISSGTTSLQSAIEQVIEVFKTMHSHKNKLLVIFTDGEDFSPHLQDVKHAAQNMQMSIFTVGMGTVEGAPIPLYDIQGRSIGHQKDMHDKIVISRLNENVLHMLAHDVGGKYIKATNDMHDMQTIAQAIRRFEKEKYEDKEIMHAQEHYPYFLLISFIFLMLEWIL